MNTSVTIDDSEMQSLLGEWMAATGKTIDHGLLTMGRSLCKTYMEFTYPRHGQYKQAMKKVSGEVGRVYASTQKVYSDIRAAAGKELAAAYWSMTHTRWNKRAADKFVTKWSPKFTGLDHMPFDGGAAHESARTGRRKSVPKAHRPIAIIAARAKKNKLEAYTRQKVANIGLAKAGWVSVWRDLGNVTDVPVWLRKNSRNRALGHAEKYLGGDNPGIVLHNTASYAEPAMDEILSKSIREESHRRLVKHFKTAISFS